ncbi:hypothetical protein HZB97_02725 [Candidatus Gottesmanbacteria bacterium]|nr:hypothetical protein [Candidatus Gottesmanbacteria bacterium]MBI5465093.1 hypothetical protein [Candidatus Gottesmanbacteria bacterium]
MRNLLTVILVVSVVVTIVIIVKYSGKSQSRPDDGNQITQVFSSEQVTLHSDQEVIDAACPTDENQKWVEGEVIDCENSPNGMFTAKFFYNGFSVPDRYYELFVVDTTNKLVKRTWAGDFRTLGWDWRRDNKIEVRYNCGSGCQATKIMDTNESASITDYRDGRMSEENGWRIKFTESF